MVAKSMRTAQDSVEMERSIPEVVLCDMENCQTVTDWVIKMLTRQAVFCPDNLTITFPNTRVGVLIKDGKVDRYINGNIRALKSVMPEECTSLPCERLVVKVDEANSSVNISWKKKRRKPVAATA